MVQAAVSVQQRQVAASPAQPAELEQARKRYDHLQKKPSLSA